MARRLVGAVLAGSLLLLICAALSLACGSLSIPPAQLLAAACGAPCPETVRVVVWELRLPRIALAALVGASLSLAGAAFQSLLRNPLADPYMVGTSAGAAFGAAIGIVLGLNGFAVPLLAFGGALASVAAVYRLARVGPVLPVETFLLAGVVVSAFLGSLVSLVLAFSRQQMARIIFWLMGDLADAHWSTVAFLAPYVALGAAGLYCYALPLNLLTLGEESASMLGVDTERLKPRLVVLGSLLTAAAVSACGLIGFVGLIVPHLARKLLGADHRLLLPGSALLGASGLVVCDTAARTLVPGGEIPVGIVTAIVGAPFFLILLRRRQP